MLKRLQVSHIFWIRLSDSHGECSPFRVVSQCAEQLGKLVIDLLWYVLAGCTGIGNDTSLIEFLCYFQCLLCRIAIQSVGFLLQCRQIEEAVLLL